MLWKSWRQWLNGDIDNDCDEDFDGFPAYSHHDKDDNDKKDEDNGYFDDNYGDYVGDAYDDDKNGGWLGGGLGWGRSNENKMECRRMSGVGPDRPTTAGDRES